MSNSLRPHGSQHARPPCPSSTPGVYPNSCPLSQWCYPTISFSVVPFSFCLQSFPASGSFQRSRLFKLGSQSIGVSASTSVLPMNTQDWSPLGWTGWISLQSKGFSRVLELLWTRVYKPLYGHGHNFFSFGWTPWRGMAGSQDTSMRNFPRNCPIVFQSGCTSHILTSSVWLQFIYILANPWYGWSF